MIFYLSIYLIIGVLTIFILKFMNEEDDGNFLSLLKVKYKIFTFDWFLEDVLVPLLGYTFIVIAWPIGIWMLLKNKLFPPEPYVPKPEIVFVIKPENLLSKQSIDIIEEQELVIDPLNAAPEIPFGHLNQSWLVFKGNIEEHDEIWSFKAMFKPEYVNEYARNGYVLVRENKPTSNYFECD